MHARSCRVGPSGSCGDKDSELAVGGCDQEARAYHGRMDHGHGDGKHDEPQHFIRAMIAEDLARKKFSGRVVTRFPPEPNGYLHIGHAKAICLNFLMAAEHERGRCHLRFDDTNPTTEDNEYVEAIKRDIRWLGFDWGEHEYFTSGHFEQLYAFAEQLIGAGRAYVDSMSQEEIRAHRGTISEAGRPSRDRDRSIAENLDLFRRMRAGEFEDGAHVLRAKIDMAAANMQLRDPLLYRIRNVEHHRTGSRWCIYPMYDYAHCLSDAIEQVTHSLCTLEFENNRDVYDWVIEAVGKFDQRPFQTEFARLELSSTITSKRKLRTLVDEEFVDGWDDPRMPTLAGLRRRGVPPEAIRSFCDRVGVSKANSVVDLQLFEHVVRDELNQRAPRVMVVLRPLKVVIENYPEAKVGAKSELHEAPYWPHDVPKEGSRELPFSRVIYIEREDFQMHPAKGFFRLAPGREVRLRYAYFVVCQRVISDPTTGEILELRCTYDPETRGGNASDGRKVKGTIHWVSAEHAVDAEIRLYDRLFVNEDPGSGGKDFRDELNPRSLDILVDAKVEPSLADVTPGSHFQFERQGYFYSDPKLCREGRLVFNRTVSLRDSWARRTEKNTPVAPPPAERTASEKTSERSPRPKKRSKAELRAQMMAAQPELAATERRFREILEIGVGDVEALTGSMAVADFFEAALAEAGQSHLKLVTNWVVNEVLRELKGQELSALPFEGASLGRLVAMIATEAISGKIAKVVFSRMLAGEGDPEAIVESKGLRQISDPALLQPRIEAVLAANPMQLAQYRGGNGKLFGFFVGAAMKATEGKAQPKLLNTLLRVALDEKES